MKHGTRLETLGNEETLARLALHRRRTLVLRSVSIIGGVVILRALLQLCFG